MADPLLPHLAHQSHQIFFRVAEEHHPQIVIGHSGDHVRLILKPHAFLFHRGVHGLDLGNGKVQNRAGVIEFGLLRPCQHQANAAAVEEGQARPRFEQQFQPQRVLIESGGPLHVMGVDCDLANARDPNCGGCDIHGLTSWVHLVSIANYISPASSRKKCRRAETECPSPNPLPRPTSLRLPTGCIPPPSICCVACASRMSPLAKGRPASRRSPCWFSEDLKHWANWPPPNRSSHPP